ncbi:MAG TPA: hypothetical protein VHA37_01190 [Candidatus Saccharimonadales bacterium]|nr:hypothetical protein [Candidatus Saccharimonadales bacterium]
MAKLRTGRVKTVRFFTDFPYPSRDPKSFAESFRVFSKDLSTAISAPKTEVDFGFYPSSTKPMTKINLINNFIYFNGGVGRSQA